MKCPQCGTEYMAFELVCPHCGREADAAALEAERQAEPPHAPPPVDDVPPPGSIMIRVLGILAIIGGISALIASFIVAGNDNGDLSGSPVLVFEVIIPLITILFGIVAVVLTPNRAAGIAAIIFGVIIIVMRIIDLMWASSSLKILESSNIMPLLVGFVLPILYIVGGCIRCKAKM